MKNAKTLLERSYTPAMVMSLYKSEADMYIETHEVSDKGEILEGRPLTHETVDDILNRFSRRDEKIRPKGIVPRNLLYMDVDREYYVWTNQPRKRKLIFTDSLGIPDGEVMLPSLVFVVSKKSLYVYAKKKDDKLYRAPFHNVSNDGLVCQGSARANLKSNTFEAILSYWEDIFFGSKFSHTNGGNPTNTDLNEVLLRLIETGSSFDPEELTELPNKKTLKDLFK